MGKLSEERTSETIQETGERSQIYSGVGRAKKFDSGRGKLKNVEEELEVYVSEHDLRSEWSLDVVVDDGRGAKLSKAIIPHEERKLRSESELATTTNFLCRVCKHV